MELLEGAPLSDYFVSMEEKGSKFSEDRLWRIFLQLLLALRYLHKDKKVIHRDLSPANIMLNEDDKLTISTEEGVGLCACSDNVKIFS